MLITMIHTRYGSESGFEISRFYAGKTYEVSDSLGLSLVKWGAAKRTEIVDGCTNPEWYNVFFDGSIEQQIIEQNKFAADSVL